MAARSMTGLDTALEVALDTGMNTAVPCPMPVGIIDHVVVHCHQDMLDCLARATEPHLGIPALVLMESLWERELLGSTGIGYGVALPNARLDGVQKVTTVLMRLSEPVACEAVDCQDVDLVVGVFSPRDAAGDHLRALAALAKLLSNAHVRTYLRQAEDVSSLRDAWRACVSGETLPVGSKKAVFAA